MRRKFRVTVNGKEYIVEVEELSDVTPERGLMEKKIEKKPVSIPKAQTQVPRDGAITAPMPGKIVSINVKEGDKVEEGAVLMILEAMKMENTITASKPGVVKEISVKVGNTVKKGDVLLVIE